MTPRPLNAPSPGCSRLPRARRTRAFAMLLALAMLGLIAMLLLFLATYFAYERQRTRSISTDAQLSQLLLAASHDALARAQSWPATAPSASWTLDLPQPLARDQATVSLSAAPTSPDSAAITIDARYHAQQASQTLNLHRTNTIWQIASAELAGAQ